MAVSHATTNHIEDDDDGEDKGDIDVPVSKKKPKGAEKFAASSKK